MMNATTSSATAKEATTITAGITATLTNLLARLVDGNQSATRRDMDHAYKRFAAENAIWVDSLFDRHFLDTHGEATVTAYLSGQLTRHQAAVQLAQAWATHMLPANVKLRKVHMADAAMTADRYLSLLTE